MISFLLSVFSCCANKQIKPVDNTEKYSVYKIDSINNFYLIYINFQNKNYKVVSKKSLSQNCKPIRVGEKYDFFNLQRIIIAENYIPINVATGSPLEFVPDCIKFDEGTEICRERGMDNIYTTDNLIGLCYIKTTTPTTSK